MVSSVYWNNHLLYDNQATIATRKGLREFGVGMPARTNTIERVGSDVGVFGTSADEEKLYEIQLMIVAASKAALDDEVAQWTQWHIRTVGTAELKRITSGGDTLVLDARAETPSFGEEQIGRNAKRVTQRYVAAVPYWRANAETASATANFNATTPVNISCAVASYVQPWPRIVITGLVNTPKITLTDGSVVEINVAMTHADSVLVINYRPPVAVTYTPNGGSATNYFGYHTSNTTKFSRLTVGTNNVSIVAASGDATCVVNWYEYYGALT